jgi:hypothetical protein
MWRGALWLNTKLAVSHLPAVRGMGEDVTEDHGKNGQGYQNAGQHSAKHAIAMCHLIGQFYVVILCLSFHMVAHL